MSDRGFRSLSAEMARAIQPALISIGQKIRMAAALIAHERRSGYRKLRIVPIGSPGADGFKELTESFQVHRWTDWQQGLKTVAGRCCSRGMQPVRIDALESLVRGAAHLDVLVHQGDDQVFDGGGVPIETYCGGGGLADVGDGIGQKRQ